jgi:hypothetical protein
LGYLALLSLWISDIINIQHNQYTPVQDIRYCHSWLPSTVTSEYIDLHIKHLNIPGKQSFTILYCLPLIVKDLYYCRIPWYEILVRIHVNSLYNYISTNIINQNLKSEEIYITSHGSAGTHTAREFNYCISGIPADSVLLHYRTSFLEVLLYYSEFIHGFSLITDRDVIYTALICVQVQIIWILKI